MTNYISILRGINVSGHRPVRMAYLREHLSGLGFEQVQTYIQSGNIVFKAQNEVTGNISKSITGLIKNEYGYDVPVITIPGLFLKNVIDANPFLNEDQIDYKHLHVTFLSEIPEVEFLTSLASFDAGVNRFLVNKNVIYLHCPEGYGRSRLSNNFFESKLKVTATTRNWKTVLKLNDIVSLLD